MATYNPLRDHLKAQAEPELTLTYADVTKLLKPNIIPGNSGSWVQAPNLAKLNEELKSVGYVGSVNPDTKTVTFRRIGSPID